MVKFGKRMVAMQHLGWEAHYINYDDLKVTIGKLDACSTDAEIKAVSDQFCDELTKAFKRVDSFVLAETKSLRSAFNSSDAASLRKVHSSVRALRGFVGALETRTRIRFRTRARTRTMTLAPNNQAPT